MNLNIEKKLREVVNPKSKRRDEIVEKKKKSNVMEDLSETLKSMSIHDEIKKNDAITVETKAKFSCSECGLSYKTEGHMKRHAKTKHDVSVLRTDASGSRC